MARASVGMMRGSSLRGDSHDKYSKLTRDSARSMNETMTRWLKGLEHATVDSTEKALRETIMAYSLELVPVATGALRDSHYVERRKYISGTEVAFGYAKGGYPHYASFVHEATWMKHAKGKSAKFLERAVNERIHVFRQKLSEYTNEIEPPKVGSRGMFGRAG